MSHGLYVPMRLLASIPLFAWLLIAANVIMLSGPPEQSMLNVVLLEFTLPSDREIVITVSDALIFVSLVFLYGETVKATRTSVIAIIDHTLSLLVFLAFLVEFLIVPRLGNTTFAILCAGSFLDVISGFTVTISTARRDFNVG